MASTYSPLPPKKRRRQSGQKRAPYVATACDSCHARKLRCSGGRPCERCSKQGTSCSYPVEVTEHMPSSRQKYPVNLLHTIEQLQSQLSAVKSQLKPWTSLGTDNISFDDVGLEDEAGEQVLAPTEAGRLSATQDDPCYYAGPTSSTYSLSTADSRLSNAAKPEQVHEAFLQDDFVSGKGLRGVQSSSNPAHARSNSQNNEILLIEAMALEDVERCIDTFSEVFGVLHPVPSLQKIRAQALQLLRATRRSLRSRPSEPGDCGILEMFKCIVAIGNVCIEGSPTPLSRALYRSLEPVLGDAVFARNITHEFRILLLLVALYHFSCDDLALGTRALMLASRTAVEAGLYRRARLEALYPEGCERARVINLLWSLFVLDMQFNYAAGLPNIMSERHVDLPRPVGAPYLSAMVEYVLLGSQAWTTIVGKEVITSGASPSGEALSYFRYQLDRWQQQLHPTVRFDATAIEGCDGFFTSPDVTDGLLYLKTLLYLRSNQIQILVLRPILMHSQSAQREATLAKEVVDLACRSIRTLCHLAKRSEIYRIRQVVFNHFLGSSLAVLFMAAAHDVESRNRANEIGRSNLLLDGADVLCEGLDLMDRSNVPRLISCFERPRQRLTNLGILGPQPKHNTRGDMPEVASNTFGALTEGDYDASNLLTNLDFSASDFLFDDSAFTMDWLDDAWTQPLAPFGVPSWM